jgi:1,4-alpha-glucan branching enzyme
MTVSLLGDVDLHLFNEGTHARLWEHLGAHLVEDAGGRAGVWFGVWAPNAAAVSVIGDWNDWREGADALAPRDGSGVWEAFVPGVTRGARYKYAIRPRGGGGTLLKADPMALRGEVPPATASVVWDLDGHRWGDGEWMVGRAARAATGAPISIYEVHLGSWRRVPEEGGRSLGYREMAPRLAEHVRRLGFTHVELMPVMEHPFYGSWGYQVTGYFAPTARYGAPEDLMFLVDTLHQAGVGVILDWVPAHFPGDAHGLAWFDGTCLYEHADPRQGFHPEWKSSIFNYGRHEVRSFLVSNACYWLDRYHVDGLRVDAVASMLYLDYGRQGGEWVPNRYGGRENLEAIEFLRQLNDTVGRGYPGVLTIAEESTAWPMVTRPAHLGGLGFSLKWDLGWMHDTLRYLGRDPVHRRFHHSDLTFRGMYAASEAYVLPLSHDEVVYGKGSLVRKMAGGAGGDDLWQRLANLRLLYAWQWAQPGKKLLFMGSELAPWTEWNHDASLDWHLERDERHARVALLVGELNRLYRDHPALARGDADARGFEWLEVDNADQSVLAFARLGDPGDPPIVAVFNFTPVPRHDHRIGVPWAGYYRELLNTDALAFGGSGLGNAGGVFSSPTPWHGRPHSLSLTLPPLAALLLRPQ